MLIAGGILIVVAAVLAFVAWDARRKLQVMQRTETLGCGELSELSAAARDSVGVGSFARVCEVAGVGRPGPQGPLTAPESKVECVWYRTRVIEHYWDSERDSDGNRRRVKRTRTVAEHSSEAPLIVDDGTGHVLVDPKGAQVDDPEQALDRYEEAGGKGIAALADLIGFGGGDRTAGLEYKEWVVRPNSRLFVLGEASDRRGELGLAKPDKGPLIISTRSEEELQRSHKQTATIAGIAGAVAAVAGVALLVAGALA